MPKFKVVHAVLVLTLIGLGITLPAPATAQNSCQTIVPPVGPDYQDCGLGQIYNILPPGSNGLTNAGDYIGEKQGQANPPHQLDQLGMYAGLAGVAPHLVASDIENYFKVSTLGYGTTDIGSIDQPQAGTVIVWDRSYGVPHVYGATRAATEFGAGYAAAHDRLFVMDVLRHVGRAQLSAFIGPSPSNLAQDCSVARAAGYSEAELQAQYDNLSAEFTQPMPGVPGVSLGRQLQLDGQAYVDGVNAYIHRALLHPSLLPVEYPALQETPARFKVTDVISVATLVQAIFATGGGDEARSTLLYGDLLNHYGAQRGTAIFKDLRDQNDPRAVTTLDQPFPYMIPGKVDPNSLAIPTGLPQSSFCNGAPLPDRPTGNPGVVSVGPVHIDLSPLFRHIPQMSNALLVDAKHSATGHPIAVFGPQVSYFAPQFLHEEDLHGPGINARGVSFPGTDIVVELGRGSDYAWSATSASSDMIDQVAEKLCNTDGTAATLASTAYVYKGVCTPMYERTDYELVKPSPAAPNPPQVVSIHIERSVHGPIVGRTTAIDPTTGRAIPIAVSTERSTFMDELSAAPTFMLWQNPDYMHGARDFIRAAGFETGTFNWFYIDSRDIAYYSSGRLPNRPSNVDPSLMRWGTGEWDWKGFLPSDASAADPHPRAINPPRGYMTNWNNKPAPQFSAADDHYTYGPVYRSQSLTERVQAVLARGKASPVDIVNAMGDAATVDLDGTQVVPYLKAALASAALTPAESRVLSILSTWAAGGGHRRALVDPSRYDEGSAVAIMDRLYTRIAAGLFAGTLQPGDISLLEAINPDHDAPGPKGSAYDGGWEGYIQRALRQAVNPAIPDAYTQNYCGAGSLKACQSMLTGALDSTISDLTAAYGSADPSAWTCDRANTGARCNPAADDIVFNPVGVEAVPNIPWQNRPTWQQVVSYPAGR